MSATKTQSPKTPPALDSETPYHGARYPWSEWFEMGTFRLERGTHYDCNTFSMGYSARRAAKLMGLKISIQTMEQAIIIRVLGPDPSVKEPARVVKTRR